MRIDILSLFPGMFPPVLGGSILGIAQEKGHLDLHLHDIRTWTQSRHGKVDDKPFGGGPGMVLCCQPVVDAVEAVRALAEPPGRLIFLGPDGKRFDQSAASGLAPEPRLILVCGRYEGFDARIFELLAPEVISLGDFVLSGGEIAAMAVVEATVRLLPGVLGSGESLEHESFSVFAPPPRAKGKKGPSAPPRRLLDYPHYTQPAVFRGLAVPEVLRGGDHAKIAAWRREQAEEKTRALRPDLLES